MQAKRYESAWEGRVPARIAMLVGAFLAAVVLCGAMASTAAAKKQVGMFLSGEASAEAAKQPHFNAESYPAYLASASATSDRWETQLGTLECPVDFSGAMSGSGSNLRLTKFVHYFSCKAPLGPVTINWGGCEDTLDLLNAGPPYVAEYGLDCPAGNVYQFGLGSLCVISLPDQSGLAQVDLENTGSGSSRAVNVDIEVTGLKYTLSGNTFFCKNGTYEDGTYTSSKTLKAYDEPY